MLNKLEMSRQWTVGFHAVRSLSKSLAHTCNCVIVLPESNGILEYGNDRDRELYLYVDEMGKKEAKTLLEKLGVTLSEKELTYLLENVGSLPSTLVSFADYMKRSWTLQQFVADKLMFARRGLMSFPHKAILKALKEHPEGVSPDYFNNQMSKGVDLSDPQEVGVAMKKSNVIVYRLDLDQYQLLSTSHCTALKNYDPNKLK